MSSPETKPASPPAPQDSGFGIRLGLLVGLLLIAVAAFAYDRYAWTQAKEAYDLLLSLPKNEKFAKKNITQEEIHEALGRKPVESRNVDANKVEDVFQWQRGIPFRTYDVIVEYYKGNGERLLFSTVSSVGIEGGDELPPPPPTKDMPPAALPPGPPMNRGGGPSPMPNPMDPGPSPMKEPAAEPAPKEEPAPKIDS